MQTPADPRIAFGKPIERAIGVGTAHRTRAYRYRDDTLAVLKAAYAMDVAGNKAARAEIAMIKVGAPHIALKIIDDAIQAHGGAGVADDFGLAEAYANTRPDTSRGWTGRSAQSSDSPARDEEVPLTHRVAFKWKRTVYRQGFLADLLRMDGRVALITGGHGGPGRCDGVPHSPIWVAPWFWLPASRKSASNWRSGSAPISGARSPHCAATSRTRTRSCETVAETVRPASTAGRAGQQRGHLQLGTSRRNSAAAVEESDGRQPDRHVHVLPRGSESHDPAGPWQHHQHRFRRSVHLVPAEVGLR